MLVGLIWAPSGSRRVHSGSLGSFGHGLGFVGFIWVRWVHTGAPWRRWIHSGSLGSFGEPVCGRWVHSGSVGSWNHALVVFRYIRVQWVHSDASRCRHVHLCSLGPFGRTLEVVRFFRVDWESTFSTSGLFANVRFIRAWPGFAGFIRDRWAKLGEP